MLGTVPQGETLGIGNIALSGKLQRVLPLREILHGEVQISGPVPAAQGTSVLIPQGHRRRKTAYFSIAVLPAQGKSSKITSIPKNLHLHASFLNFLQPLWKIHPDSG